MSRTVTAGMSTTIRCYKPEDNAEMLFLAQKYNVSYILIDDKYEINIDL